jgi:hypothetical protein
MENDPFFGVRSSGGVKRTAPPPPRRPEQPVRRPVPMATPIRPTAPAGGAGFLVGSWSTRDGVAAYREDPFDAANGIIIRLPEDQRRAATQVPEMGKRGQLTEGPHHCALWVRRGMVRAGVKSWDWTMGNAWDMRNSIFKMGGRPLQQGEQVLPGDIVVYRPGRAHSKFGHIGIALGPGEARAYIPQERGSPARPERRSLSRDLTIKPPIPMVDPLALALGQPTIVTPEGAWDYIRSLRQPPLQPQERQVLFAMSTLFPGIAPLLQFAETGKFPEDF